jgi:hypothetical protein
MNYRYDRELGIVDEEGLQVLQLVTNYCTDDFKDHAGRLLAMALNKAAKKERKKIFGVAGQRS